MHASAPKPARTFPAFSLSRLLETVFAPRGGERVALLIDLKDPRDIVDFAFLKNPAYSIQKHAYEVFYQGFQRGELKPLGLTGGDLYAYEVTGGSNLDLPDRAVTPDGREVSLEKDVYSKYDLILCISTYSATAPLTAFAKQFGFRGATLHGLNDIILSSGLAVDYNEVSKHAEKMRLALTNADWFEVDFHVAGQTHTLKLLINGQDAQKSHGLCRGTEPDVANLPAGEVYYVPAGAEGRFPMRYETGTLALMDVAGGRIVGATLIEGDQAEVDAHNAKLQSDPVTGEIGELGFGTQDLPVSGRDIQDTSPPAAATISAAISSPSSSRTRRTPRTTTSSSAPPRPRRLKSRKSACTAMAGPCLSSSTSPPPLTSWKPSAGSLASSADSRRPPGDGAEPGRVTGEAKACGSPPPRAYNPRRPEIRLIRIITTAITSSK
jgi:aminopeptidase